MLHLPKLKLAMRGRRNPQQEVDGVITYLNGLGHRKNPSHYETQDPKGKKCHVFMFDNTPIGHICLVTSSSMKPDIFFMEQTESLSPNDAHLEHKGKMYIRANEMRANPNCMCMRKNPTKTMSSWSDFKKWRRSAKVGDVLVGVSVLVYKGNGEFYAISKHDKALPEIYNDAEAYIVLGERDIANIAELKGSKMALNSHKVAMDKGFPQLTKMINEYLKGLLLEVEPQTALSRRAKSLGEFKAQMKSADNTVGKEVEPKKTTKTTTKKTTKKPKAPEQSCKEIVDKWLCKTIYKTFEKAKKQLSTTELKAELNKNGDWKEIVKKAIGRIPAASEFSPCLLALVECGMLEVVREGKRGVAGIYKLKGTKTTKVTKTPKKTTTKKTTTKKTTTKTTTKSPTIRLKVGGKYVKSTKDKTKNRGFQTEDSLKKFVKTKGYINLLKADVTDKFITFTADNKPKTDTKKTTPKTPKTPPKKALKITAKQKRDALIVALKEINETGSCASLDTISEIAAKSFTDHTKAQHTQILSLLKSYAKGAAFKKLIKECIQDGYALLHYENLYRRIETQPEVIEEVIEEVKEKEPEEIKEEAAEVVEEVEEVKEEKIPTQPTKKKKPTMTKEEEAAAKFQAMLGSLADKI